ncbi:MAG: hypothetical protein N2053_01220 [Chitinispirillaceae bacterium]|nr:hypothetical protein [Chitinispirillaceae bacterium]
MSEKRRKILILILLWSIPLVSINAQKSKMDEFLISTVKDSVLILQQQHSLMVKKHSFVMPIIGDAEIRLRKSDWYRNDSILQNIFGLRYSLRLEPRGLGETKALKDYYETQEMAEVDRYGYTFNSLLMLRYLTIIDYFERSMNVKTNEELIEVYEDKIKVMEQLKSSVDFDLNELIRCEKELSKLNTQYLEEKQERDNLCYFLGKVLGDPNFKGFDTSELISVEQIKVIVDTMNFELDEDNLTLRYMKSQFELAKKRFELEKAQNRNIISYIEFSYDHPRMLDEINRRERRRYYDSRNAFIFDIGFKIPGLTTNRQNFARREIDFAREFENYVEVRDNLKRKIKKDSSDIKALIKQYEFLRARETRVDAEASLKKYLEMSGMDPLVLLSIKENLIKNRAEKGTIYLSILRNFIYVLDITGQMSRKPLRNYLSVKQEIIEP